jgi:hypothetical protein
MLRFLFVIPLVLMVSVASAQQEQGQGQVQAQAQGRGQDACARDVSRFCRAHIHDDDTVILACLKRNRARLSKACEKVLTDNGQ